VLGTVYQTQRSAYRKPGAMMLFNSEGHRFGILSGGCVEAELHRHAMRVMLSQQAVTLCYDAEDEYDLLFKLGVGCGGALSILLQPITAANNYLHLETLRSRLAKGLDSHYCQRIPEDEKATVVTEAKVLEIDAISPKSEVSLLKQISTAKTLSKPIEDLSWLVTPIKPVTQLIVIGGGLDARPVVALAVTLGWVVTLCDPRPANARREHFPGAQTILRSSVDTLANNPMRERWDAAIVMSHQLETDARALLALQQASGLKYLGLLGPLSRKQEVINTAGLQEKMLCLTIAGPAGLALGGDLPESIALSIVSECHAALHQVDASSISGVLNVHLSSDLNATEAKELP